MVRSTPFRTSRQCQDLLRYVVEQSLAHNEESLRERVIGVEVFGRRPDYDTAEDPVVRIRAADVRKRIALYYQAGGSATPVRIEIPPGSYRACFEWTNSLPAEAEPLPQSTPRPRAGFADLTTSISLETAPASLPDRHPLRRKWLWSATVILCLAAITASSLWYVHYAQQRSFARFWSPVLDSGSSPLIYIGSNAVYALSPTFVQSYRKQHDLTQTEKMGREFFVPLHPGQKLDAGDLVAVQDTYVTIGDVAASTSITSLLARHNKKFYMRYGGDIVFGDLQQNPTILIGAFNNSWTLEMTNNLRFVFAYDHQIVDRFDSKRAWKAPENSDEDYALVTRILNSKTGQALVTVAGIGEAGTQAAASFLTNPDAIETFAATAPKGWEKKNLELVLHTSLIKGFPGSPSVVARYYW